MVVPMLGPQQKIKQSLLFPTSHLLEEEKDVNPSKHGFMLPIRKKKKLTFVLPPSCFYSTYILICLYFWIQSSTVETAVLFCDSKFLSPMPVMSYLKYAQTFVVQSHSDCNESKSLIIQTPEPIMENNKLP